MEYFCKQKPDISELKKEDFIRHEETYDYDN